MKRLALILMLVLAAGCDEEFTSRAPSRGAANKPGNVVFAFTAEWCVPCKRNMPALKRLETSGVTIYYIDIDKRPIMSKGWGITRVPTYVLKWGGGDYEYKELLRTHSVEVLRKRLGK